MIKTAIVGASGYTGLELIKILLNHPHFKIEGLFGSEGGERIEDIYPSLKGIFEAEIQKADVEKLKKFDLVFLAVPHKTAMALVKELYGKTKIVDFSADYRLSQKITKIIIVLIPTLQILKMQHTDFRRYLENL